MSAELVHAHEWDSNDTQRFIGLGVGRDSLFSYEYRKGHSTGTRVNGFDTEDIVRAFDYSAVSPGIVGYGLNSGAVYVREISKLGSAGHNASSAPGNPARSMLLKQRSTRKCNTLAFSSAGHILATGYDRLRGVESLLLWDLRSQSGEPAVNVNTHDTVVTTKFIPSVPSSLLFGGSRMIREYDMRSNTVVSTIATNMCMQIEFNPHSDVMFATYGDSSSVALWDRRTLGDTHREPLLVIPHVFKESIKHDSRCLRFSLENGNEFAALQDGSMIRRWRLSIMRNKGPATQSSQLTSGLSQQQENEHSLGSEDAPRQFMESNYSEYNTNTMLGTHTHDTQQNFFLHLHANEMENWSMFVDKVFDVHTENDKVVSFDYASNSLTEQTDFVCLRQSGTAFRMPVIEPPSNVYLDPFNDFRMTLLPHKMLETTKDDHSQLVVSDMCSKEVRFVLNGNPSSGTVSGSASPNLMAIDAIEDINSSEEDSTDSSDVSEDVPDVRDVLSEEENEELDGEIDLQTVLTNDITSIMQRRALLGYSLDAARNIDLLSVNESQISTATSSPGRPHQAPTETAPSNISLSTSTSSSGLLAAWKWVKQQNEIITQSRNYLETPEVDLRYIGVLSIWDGLSMESLEPRLMPNTKPTSKMVDDAVKYAVRKCPGSVYVSADDELTPYRQLCLRLTGWDFGLNELESRLVQLENSGQYEKAAGWAAFHNNIERAVESLAKSRKKNLRLMSTAVAGYLVYKDVPTNNVWREQCRRLASELSAPYLRAIFAFIADGSWLDVLDDGSLPLTERIGIALRFLPPKEVGKYLSLLTSRTIARGDLEGIILTGFTPKVLDLFQAYLDRTGDIQTVCLLVSFGWPRFFEDSRLPNWFAEYRQLLNSWRYFSQRARLDIARSKLVASKYSHAASPLTGQAFLRCSNCKQLINSNAVIDKRKMDAAAAGGSGKRAVAMKSSHQIWNRCPSCNHTLPVCGVCTMALGPCLDDETESDRWPMFCLKCNHGYHSVHARQWYAKYNVCPVASCACLCAMETLRI